MQLPLEKLVEGKVLSENQQKYQANINVWEWHWKFACELARNKGGRVNPVIG